MITISVTREGEGETRVALSPETTKKFKALGARILFQAGAGDRSFMPDRLFSEAGAEIVQNAADAISQADVILKVGRPSQEELKAMKPGTVFVGMIDPFGSRDGLEALAAKGVSTFAMEFMPRITRAQSMDVLSSQSNLAGYKAVVDAAAHFGRALPMMMTAAGTVPAARIFVMGAGVAGLQAIATARRLGAVISATDVRPAAKEQVASLGGKFIAVEDEEFKQAETAGGYAKEMSAEYQKEAGGTCRKPHRRTGHRDHDGPHSGPARAKAHHQGDGRKHEARLRDRGPCSRARRKRRGHKARRNRRT